MNNSVIYAIPTIEPVKDYSDVEYYSSFPADKEVSYENPLHNKKGVKPNIENKNNLDDYDSNYDSTFNYDNDSNTQDTFNNQIFEPKPRNVKKMVDDTENISDDTFFRDLAKIFTI